MHAYTMACINRLIWLDPTEDKFKELRDHVRRDRLDPLLLSVPPLGQHYTAAWIQEDAPKGPATTLAQRLSGVCMACGYQCMHHG